MRVKKRKEHKGRMANPRAPRATPKGHVARSGVGLCFKHSLLSSFIVVCGVAAGARRPRIGIRDS